MDSSTQDSIIKLHEFSIKIKSYRKQSLLLRTTSKIAQLSLQCFVPIAVFVLPTIMIATTIGDSDVSFRTDNPKLCDSDLASNYEDWHVSCVFNYSTVKARFEYKNTNYFFDLFVPIVIYYAILGVLLYIASVIKEETNYGITTLIKDNPEQKLNIQTLLNEVNEFSCTLKNMNVDEDNVEAHTILLDLIPEVSNMLDKKNPAYYKLQFAIENLNQQKSELYEAMSHPTPFKLSETEV